MAFPKGQPNPNAGRPFGAVSEKTKLARDAIAHFVDGNVDRLTGWLDRIAEDDPAGAFDRFMSVVEYHIPKLARVESQETTVNINLNLFARQSAVRERLIEDAKKIKTIERDTQMLAIPKSDDSMRASLTSAENVKS